MHAARAAILFVSLSALGASAATPDKRTERTWKAKCASCHGAEGKGDTDEGRKGNVSDMTAKAWQAAHSDDEIAKVTKEGTQKTDKHGAMDGYDLSPDDLAKMVALIRTFAK